MASGNSTMEVLMEKLQHRLVQLTAFVASATVFWAVVYMLG